MCNVEASQADRRNKSINATRDDQSLVSPPTLTASFDLQLFAPTQS